MKKQLPDSIMKVCLPFSELMAGEHTHLSFDCPKSLRKAFKVAVKANGSSICHVLQTFMVTYLVSNHYQKAYFGNTIRNPIVVENLTIPTYVKHRVRRVKHEVEEIEQIVVLGEPGVCHVCKSRAFVSPRTTVDNQRVFLCRVCAQEWICQGKIEVQKG